MVAGWSAFGRDEKRREMRQEENTRQQIVKSASPWIVIMLGQVSIEPDSSKLVIKSILSFSTLRYNGCKPRTNLA